MAMHDYIAPALLPVPPTNVHPQHVTQSLLYAMRGTEGSSPFPTGCGKLRR